MVVLFIINHTNFFFFSTGTQQLTDRLMAKCKNFLISTNSRGLQQRSNMRATRETGLADERASSRRTVQSACQCRRK